MIGGNWGYNWWGGYGYGGLVMVIALADLVLRGVAMYKAAKKDRKWWFVALLVINSAGILPLVYLLLIEKVDVKELVGMKKTKKRKK